MWSGKDSRRKSVWKWDEEDEKLYSKLGDKSLCEGLAERLFDLFMALKLSSWSLVRNGENNSRRKWREAGAIGWRSLRPLVLAREITFSNLWYETITLKRVLRRPRVEDWRPVEKIPVYTMLQKSCFFVLTTLDTVLDWFLYN